MTPPQFIRRHHPCARKSASKVVRCRMQLPPHATRRTPHGASLLVLAMSAWSVKTQRAPSRHCRDTNVDGRTTTAMHDMRPPSRRPRINECAGIRPNTAPVASAQLSDRPLRPSSPPDGTLFAAFHQIRPAEAKARSESWTSGGQYFRGEREADIEAVRGERLCVCSVVMYAEAFFYYFYFGEHRRAQVSA